MTRIINKLTVLETGILFTVAAVITYGLVLPVATYHFRQFVINFYPNGTTDFTADVTILVRQLGIMTLLCMFLGLVVGIAMGLSNAHRGSWPKGSSSMSSAQYERSLDVLLKSGLLRNIETLGGARYEITEAGTRFLKEHKELERILEMAQKPPVEG